MLQNPSTWALLIAAIAALRLKFNFELGHDAKQEADTTPESGGDAAD